MDLKAVKLQNKVSEKAVSRIEHKKNKYKSYVR